MCVCVCVYVYFLKKLNYTIWLALESEMIKQNIFFIRKDGKYRKRTPICRILSFNLMARS